MAASKLFIEADAPSLQRQSADMQSILDSFDVLIDLYTSPLVFEARQY
ncbi:MAG TPA: hypothetical protein VL991_12250 [Terracidiphilus sp.]|jgi:hypothetical protein|nr:hypothetical protein [Terracidiphilus sp.]